MQDIAGHTQLADNTKHPLGPFTYTISCMHCMSVSLAAGGPGLGAMWGREKAIEMLAAAGFSDVRVTELPHDPINYYYVAVKITYNTRSRFMVVQGSSARIQGGSRLRHALNPLNPLNPL